MCLYLYLLIHREELIRQRWISFFLPVLVERSLYARTTTYFRIALGWILFIRSNRRDLLREAAKPHVWEDSAEAAAPNLSTIKRVVKGPSSSFLDR